MQRPTMKSRAFPTSTSEPFLTVAAVAARLNVCERTVRRLIQVGLLKHQRVGRAVRVSEAGLQAYLGG
ncbi:MAG: Helix-turn-helix domain [Rhodospirillales bacterium]|jgi:excisionase family DNA binding protein|nr:Helix-turn-helix domain [Rhodospirillales bacterium]